MYEGNSYQKRQAKGNIRVWENSRYSSLDSAYGKYSAEKARAWRYCEDLCEKMNGSKLRVLAHNSFIFTAGFEFVDEETGVIKFMYITPNYDVAVDM